MGLHPLLPLAGSALAGLATDALDRLAGNTSFLDVLRNAMPQEAQQAVTEQVDPASDPHLHAWNPTGQRIQEAATRSAQLRQRTLEVAQQLREGLAAAGIDLSRSIELKSDGRGGILLDEPHPQRAEIESLIAGDPELSHALQELIVAYTQDDAIRVQYDPYRLGGEFRLRLSMASAEVDFD
jgi:hypothetical protein